MFLWTCNSALLLLLRRAADVSAGWYTSFVIDTDGKLWAFGLDNYGQATAAPKKEGLDKDEVAPCLPLFTISGQKKGIGMLIHAFSLPELKPAQSLGCCSFDVIQPVHLQVVIIFLDMWDAWC